MPTPTRHQPPRIVAAWLARVGGALLLAGLVACAGCASPAALERGAHWDAAQRHASALVQAMPDQPGYHQVHRVCVEVHLVSRHELARVVQEMGLPPHVAGLAIGGANPRVYVVAGPGWVDQWGLGHELGHLLGIDVDHFPILADQLP